EAGVELGHLNGSGPNGRVTLNDVRAAQSAPRAPAAPSRLPSAAPAPVRRAPAAPSAPGATPARPAAVEAAAAPLPAGHGPRPHELPGDERVPLRGLRKRIATQMRLAKQTAAHFTYV